MDGYANLIAARLRKLAAAGSTGMLPVSGRGDGAIFFRAGQVVYAESSRTPVPTPTLAPAPAPARPAVGLAALGLVTAEARETVSAAAVSAATAGAWPAGSAVPAAMPSLRRLAGLLAVTEPVIDAITDLLSSESRYAKFRPGVFPVAQLGPLPVSDVLTEVERRRHVLRQLAAVVTSDTPVVRNAPRDSPNFQVSASQWALLVRVGDGTTPRSLALALDRSVFGTTIEVYRLLALGLLTAPGQPPALAGGALALADGAGARRPGEVMSFMRAVSDSANGDERGSDETGSDERGSGA